MTPAVNLDRANQELEWARDAGDAGGSRWRNRFVWKRRIASMETQAESHPEWAGKVYTKYDGNGVFTAAERKTLETAWLTRFSQAAADQRGW